MWNDGSGVEAALICHKDRLKGEAMPNDEKKPTCLICDEPGEIVWESVGVFSSGYALCEECRAAKPKTEGTAKVERPNERQEAASREWHGWSHGRHRYRDQ